MKVTELKALARRFSLTDWQDICASPRSFGFSKMNPRQAQVLCEAILLERDGMMQPVTEEEETKRLSIISATFSPA
jgi:hypothetical protein